MKATGIVRRIDDLGRVVIPKEIRRTLRIREGDPLEIFTDRDGEVILKKYSPMVDLSLFAQEYADSLHEATGCIALIADEHEVVGVSGVSRKLYFEKEISEAAEGIMESGKTFVTSTPGEKPVVDGAQFACQVASPILADDEPAGVVVLMSKEPREMGPTEVKLVETAAEFLGKQLLH
ncbi:MAG: stage V sporulation T C-terminal domain-containing protein [Firmicutes bacterium]|nr:stage V sporulation T C-terminal domain-containing protein [Bacillota bacterium]MDD4336681.1 stage V sporulation T C-terminal domain-containing protein [Bacillota bacterium]